MKMKKILITIDEKTIERMNKAIELLNNDEAETNGFTFKWDKSKFIRVCIWKTTSNWKSLKEKNDNIQ